MRSVKAPTWILLALLLIVTVFGVTAQISGSVSSSTFLYVIQPVAIVVLAGIAHIVANGRRDRVRHKLEKAMIVGSIVAIWFVLYFMSGLFVTYVHNTLVVDIKSIAVNVFAFGVTAAALEYTRYVLMLSVGRRNIMWFGILVTVIFALQQMTMTQVSNIHTAEDFLKLFISGLMPAIVSSMLLTYLAVSSGLSSQLTYRLGVVAATILPPIIPKYDWYLIGVSSLLLSVAVYIAIDRNAQGREETTHRRHHGRHASRAYDVMLTIVMIGMILFFTGFFTYKPSVIVSNSMVPVFSRGSLVVVQKVSSPLDINRGDIVQYKALDHMITHRVVAIDSASDGSGKRVFTTKGDNSPSKDPPVKGSQIVGVVRAQVPYIGYPTVWLHELAR